jgi:hypothetical protein
MHGTTVTKNTAGLSVAPARTNAAPLTKPAPNGPQDGTHVTGVVLSGIADNCFARSAMTSFGLPDKMPDELHRHILSDDHPDSP